MSAASATTARAVSRAATGALSASSQTGAEPLPATDTLWREVYHVIAPLPSDEGIQLWRAHRTDTAQEVVLRVAPGAKGDTRSAALNRLSTVDLTHLQRVREGHFVGNNRVEVCDAVHGVPLDIWRRERASVDGTIVETVVCQLAEALGVLHATGLVHLGLRPGAVFVREEQGGLHCTLGGLEHVAFFDGAKPIPAAVDPLYAPPEAVALTQHEPGPALCAWDWWSLGRVAQELILGHHVVESVPGTDRTLALAARAEALLTNESAKGLRAGGMEVLTGLEPRLQLLLRGLLSSAPEVRWKGDAVDRWVKQLPVNEHYTTPRTEKKFRWHGRLCTVAEAAKELQAAEHWAEAAKQIFEKNTPGTLANYIGKSPELKTVAPQLAEILKLAEAEPLSALPPAVTREVLTTVALVQLSGGNLIWRGRRLDGESLGTILTEDAENPERLAFVRALTHRTITGQIDRCDFAAGRSLSQVGRGAADAEAIIRRNGWLKGADDGAVTKIFRLALDSDATLLAARQRLQRDFACSNLPAIEKSFKVAKPAHVELVVLAWVEPTASQCGFVTHVDWEAKQLQQLQERSGPVRVGLFWAALGRALAAGPAIFGPWLAVAFTWLAIAGLVAFVAPGPKWLAAALAPVALVFAARFAMASIASAAVRRFASTARPWKWSDGARRCDIEVTAAGKGLDAAGLERARAEINSEMAKLTLLTPAPAPLGEPPRFGAIRGAAIGSWILLGVIAVGGAWRATVRAPSSQAFLHAWFPTMTFEAPLSAAAKAAEAAKFAAKAAASEKEIAANAVKVSWPYHSTDDFETLTPIDAVEATAAQTAYAMQRGRAIAAPYRKETINSLVMFEVPADGKIGVMVFDGAKDSLAMPKVFILGYRPPAREWVELAGKKAVVVPE